MAKDLSKYNKWIDDLMIALAREQPFIPVEVDNNNSFQNGIPHGMTLLSKSLSDHKDKENILRSIKQEAANQAIEHLLMFPTFNQQTLDQIMQFGGDLRQGVDPKLKQTLLHKAVLKGDEPSAKLLIDIGIDESKKDINGETAQDIAQKTEHKVNTIKSLLIGSAPDISSIFQGTTTQPATATTKHSAKPTKTSTRRNR